MSKGCKSLVDRRWPRLLHSLLVRLPIPHVAPNHPRWRELCANACLVPTHELPQGTLVGIKSVLTFTLLVEMVEPHLTQGMNRFGPSEIYVASFCGPRCGEAGRPF